MTLTASNLTVRYGSREILKGLNFEARAGEVTMIIGPNGSGKSTLMKALSGDLPFDGSIRINGDDISALKPREMAVRRGVLAQETQLSFPFTVSEIVRIGLQASGDPPTSIGGREQRIYEALSAVDLAGFGGRFYQELSGGERQRVQLARVLCQVWEPVNATGPSWLYLDEPISSLDIRHQVAVMELARDYANRGGGVVAVMHDLNLAAAFGDRVALMSHGALAAFGHPRDVFLDDAAPRAFGCPLAVTQGHENAGGLVILPCAVAARRMPAMPV